MSQCSQHPDRSAGYHCESCGNHLCDECVDSGHALLFCRLCGEQALPLNAAGVGGSSTASAGIASTGSVAGSHVQARQRQKAVSGPYSFGEALFYPFRGLGAFLYVGAILAMLLLAYMPMSLIGRLVLTFLFWSMMIGLQFKIIRTSAEGSVELPDWPEYGDFGERLLDIFAYLFATALLFGPAGVLIWFGRSQVFSTEPNPLFWFLVALLGWLGAALSVVALGAAGRFHRFDVLRIPSHIKALRFTGADGITVANLTFGLGIAVYLLFLALQEIPYVGNIASFGLAAYWIFVSAHFVGVLMRRHIFVLEALYD